MDETQNTGVENQVEAEATVSSPAENETPQDMSTEETSASVESTDENTDKAIPYSRFKEVNERSKQYEEQIKQLQSELQSRMTPAQPEPQLDPQAEQVKQTLKQYGFMAKEDVDAELRRLREDTALERKLSQLENSYSGKDGRPKFKRSDVVNFAIENQIADPEAAYKLMHEKELIDWHIRQASGKSSGVQTERSDGSGQRQAGPSNDDLMSAAIQGDDNAFNTMLKRTKAFKHIIG